MCEMSEPEKHTPLTDAKLDELEKRMHTETVVGIDLRLLPELKDARRLLRAVESELALSIVDAERGSALAPQIRTYLAACERKGEAT
jgi:hypothetical protein